MEWRSGKGGLLSFPGFLPKSGWQVPASPFLGLRGQAVTTPAAMREREQNHHCPEVQNCGQAEYSEQNAGWGDTVTSGRSAFSGCLSSAPPVAEGTAESGGADVLLSVRSETRRIIVMLPRRRYSFLVSDACVYQSNFYVTCGTSLSHTVVSVGSL